MAEMFFAMTYFGKIRTTDTELHLVTILVSFQLIFEETR